MSRKSINKWTPAIISEYAKLFSTRGDFSREAQGAYQAARKMGILDKVCAHMRQTKWTKQLLQKEAQRFRTRSDFYRGSPSAYQLAHRRNWLNDICAHMEVGKCASDYDTFYMIWDLEDHSGKTLVKFGVTSARLGLQRVEKHCTKHFKRPHIGMVIRSSGALELERFFLKQFDVRPEGVSGDGYTELRIIEKARLKSTMREAVGMSGVLQ